MPTIPAGEPAKYPRFRVLTAAEWQISLTMDDPATKTTGASWEPQAMWGGPGGKIGFDIISFRRRSLPEMGDAILRYRVGRIDGQIIGSAANGQWNPATSTPTVPDLQGKYIRIQEYIETVTKRTVYSPDGGSSSSQESSSIYGNDQTSSQDLEDGSTEKTEVYSKWRTVWLGFCEYMQDKGWPGSGIPNGERYYYCWDLFALTTKWFPTRHLYELSSADESVGIADGAHPGYNQTIGNEGIVRGNKSPFDSKLVDILRVFYADNNESKVGR